MFSYRGKLKKLIMSKFVYLLRLQINNRSSTETVAQSVVADAKDGDLSHFKNLGLNFSKFS